MTATRFEPPPALVPRARASRPQRRASLAPLIGREAVLDRIEGVLRSGARVVTLTGPPGIGKTRASLACLERLTPEFARGGGAWFCDLSRVKTERELGFTVLSLLRGRFEGGPLAEDDAPLRVQELLEEAGPTLLVLDNFEQIVSAAKTVERWCEAAPRLVVLVTSRERLGLGGEVVVELPPLECPPADGDDQAIAASPAVLLFLKRARDVGSTLPDDPRALAEIVRRLEGIPLAIELAAARTRLLSLPELAERLSRGHGVLAQATRRSDSRHATLANAIEWSWGLLPEGEQVALARCSVFAGSFTVDAAESVVGEPEAVELLAALRDKSLLHAQPDGRLALYVSIRDHASAKLVALGAGEAARARAAHARTFGEMARRFNEWRQMLSRASDGRVHAVLRREKENLAAAIAYLRDAPPSDETAVLRAELVVAAAQLHAMPAEACVAELTFALAALGDAHPTHRGLVLVARQSVHASLGDEQLSLADLDALARTPGLPLELALLARVYKGIQLRYFGSPREAWESHVEARGALLAAELPRLRAMNEACMGRLAFDLGDHEASRRYNESAIALADELGDSWLGALALANLAQLEQELQRFERAEELLARSLALLRELGDIYEAVYSSACGDLFFEWGKVDLGRTWYATGARFFRSSFITHRHAALGFAAAAALEARDGDFVRANALLDVARRSASRAKNRVIDAGVDLHSASVALLEAGGAERARVLAAWEPKLARYGDPGDPLGAVVATSFDARFALRITRRTFAPPSPSEAVGTARLLRAQKDGRWFEIDGGARVELGRRGALRRILVALAKHHDTHRERGLKQGALALAGWPGERVLVEAAATRVRVAVATLRRLGLRSLLLTRDDGYLLDGSARVELCD